MKCGGECDEDIIGSFKFKFKALFRSLLLKYLFFFLRRCESLTSKSSSLLRCNSNGDSLSFVLLLDRLLVDETVEIDEGDEGMELECDDDGGVSKRGKDDSKGSFSFRSFSHSIKSSSSFKLMIFLSLSSSAQMICREGF